MSGTQGANSNNCDFVIEDGFDFEGGPLVVNGQGRFFVGDQAAQFAGAEAGWQLDFNAQGADRQEFLDGRAPGAGIGEIDDVQNHAPGLAVEMAINEAVALDA